MKSNFDPSNAIGVAFGALALLACFAPLHAGLLLLVAIILWALGAFVYVVGSVIVAALTAPPAPPRKRWMSAPHPWQP